jgi:hypothetical protein
MAFLDIFVAIKEKALNQRRERKRHPSVSTRGLHKV